MAVYSNQTPAPSEEPLNRRTAIIAASSALAAAAGGVAYLATRKNADVPPAEEKREAKVEPRYQRYVDELNALLPGANVDVIQKPRGNGTEDYLRIPVGDFYAADRAVEEIISDVREPANLRKWDMPLALVGKDNIDVGIPLSDIERFTKEKGVSPFQKLGEMEKAKFRGIVQHAQKIGAEEAAKGPSIAHKMAGDFNYKDQNIDNSRYQNTPLEITVHQADFSVLAGENDSIKQAALLYAKDTRKILRDHFNIDDPRNTREFRFLRELVPMDKPLSDEALASAILAVAINPPTRTGPQEPMRFIFDNKITEERMRGQQDEFERIAAGLGRKVSPLVHKLVTQQIAGQVYDLNLGVDTKAKDNATKFADMIDKNTPDIPRLRC